MRVIEVMRETAPKRLEIAVKNLEVAGIALEYARISEEFYAITVAKDFVRFWVLDRHGYRCPVSYVQSPIGDYDVAKLLQLCMVNDIPIQEGFKPGQLRSGAET